MKKFIIDNITNAKADIRMDNSTSNSLWNNFCFGKSKLNIVSGDNNTFLIGNIPMPKLPARCDYAITVTEAGAAIRARNYSGLMRGFIHLLYKIELDTSDAQTEIICVQPFTDEKSYSLEKRMAHFCVFRETDIELVRQEIRYAGILHFTHVVLEFWGMLKFDCLKELSWPDAYSKEQAADLIREIREFGMEPIPFFNHLGHASLSKISTGEHVVLNQNPGLQGLFFPEGWEWNIFSDKTKKLLTDVRKELTDIFGNGEYFHIGCDEAYMILNNDKLKPEMADYVRELTEKVESEGRKPLLWADMYISQKEIRELPAKNTESLYWAPCKNEYETNFQLDSLSKNSILIDWQYEVTETPFRSYMNLKSKGFNVMTAPWKRTENCVAALDTAVKYDGYGIMCTTWNEVSESFYGMYETAIRFGAPEFDWAKFADRRALKATLLRKIKY